VSFDVRVWLVRHSIETDAIMNEYQSETSFLRHLIRYDDSEERLKLEQSMAQVQQDERCVQRVASVTALVSVLAMACIASGDVLQGSIPFIGSERVIRVLCEVVLASLICLVTFVGLLADYRHRLNRLREEGRQLVTRLVESHLGKPHVPTWSGNQPRRESANFTAAKAAGREGDSRLLDAAFAVFQNGEGEGDNIRTSP
jgi:hypothetical protein